MLKAYKPGCEKKEAKKKVLKLYWCLTGTTISGKVHRFLFQQLKLIAAIVSSPSQPNFRRTVQAAVEP
jgi:hypothetical protein